MAGKNWQTGGKLSIPAGAGVSLTGILAPVRAAWDVAPAGNIGSADPNMIWEILIGGLVVCFFLAAVVLWILSALRKIKRAQLRKNAFVSSALNNLNQGVVMTDSHKRVVFCNDRYLEIYGLSRSDIRKNMTGADLLELRRRRGVLGAGSEDFYAQAGAAEGLITELPGGRSIVTRYFTLPNGGSVATHEDCTEQRKLSRQLASTKQFLETMLDNVPVCVAAKNIEDGRYIFVNRAFERFAHFSRDTIVGKHADEVFPPSTAQAIEAADAAALAAPDATFRSEIVVERG